MLTLNANEKAKLQHMARSGDFIARAIVDLLDARVANGLMAAAPTTPSAQTTGAAETAWRVDVDKGLVVIDGFLEELAAQADFVIHDTTQLVTDGQSCIATLVVKKAANGAISVVAVKGTAATTGDQVAPTEAAIQAGVGAGLKWVKLAECTINRTGDTTVTQSQDNEKMNVGPMVR